MRSPLLLRVVYEHYVIFRWYNWADPENLPYGWLTSMQFQFITEFFIAQLNSFSILKQ